MKKTPLILTLILSSILLFHAIMANAQLQTATLAIIPGPVSFAQLPDDFNFDTSFVPNTSETISIYKVLSPSITENTLNIADPDTSNGFSVSVSLTDFESQTGGSNRIHYTNLGLVALSESLTEQTDGPGTNSPSGAPNVISPLHCNWDTSVYPTLSSVCNDSINAFAEPAANTTLLTNPVTTVATTINVADGTQLADATSSEPQYITINSDVIMYTGITANQLTGVTLISTDHAIGETVTQYYRISDETTLLSNTNVADIGEYSTGLGFRLNYDDAVIPDTYNATLTFTLIPIP